MEFLKILLDNSALVLFSAIAILLGIIFLFNSFLKEVKRLEKAIGVLNIEGTLLPRTLFSNPIFQNTWEFIRSQQLQLQQLRARAISSPSMADFGAKMVRNTCDSSKLSSSIIDLILQKSPAEIVAAAVILKNEKGDVEVKSCRGVPIERLNEALLFCSDYFFDDSSQFQNKFFNKSNDVRFDFSFFGIKQSVFRPLIENNVCHGIVWLGLKNGSMASSTFDVLDDVVVYASASFGSFKQIEKREKGKDNEKDFLLGLSHDLRSPGNRALFSVREILFEGNISKEQEESLRIAEDSIVEQLRMLDNVLDIAKHDSGLLDPVQREVPLKSFLESSISRFKYEYQHKGLSLELICDHSIQLFVDYEHIARISNNLLSNALKFTESGGVVVEVSIEGKTVVVSYTDTGKGISPEKREQIFNRFDQGNAAKAKDGVGLGLFLSRTLAERNGGHLYHQDSPFGGSKFVMELPVYKITSNKNDKIIHLDSNSSVLIVEDDAATARMYKRYLSSYYSKVATVETLEEVECMLAKDLPSVVVSDYHLGSDTAADFFNKLPSSIALLVVSGSAEPIVIDRIGKSLVLQKPVDKEDIISAISSLTNFRLRMKSNA